MTSDLSRDGLSPRDHKRLHEATHVMVRDTSSAANWIFDGYPRAIALDVGPRVWVHGSYADDMLTGMLQVGDGTGDGYSSSGDRLISVPAAWCSFLTDEEASAALACIDADYQLLRYAR